MPKELLRKNLPKNWGFLLPTFQGLLTEPATTEFLNSISYQNSILITEDFTRKEVYETETKHSPTGYPKSVK